MDVLALNNFYSWLNEIKPSKDKIKDLKDKISSLKNQNQTKSNAELIGALFFLTILLIFIFYHVGVFYSIMIFCTLPIVIPLLLLIIKLLFLSDSERLENQLIEELKNEQKLLREQIRMFYIKAFEFLPNKVSTIQYLGGNNDIDSLLKGIASVPSSLFYIYNDNKNWILVHHLHLLYETECIGKFIIPFEDIYSFTKENGQTILELRKCNLVKKLFFSSDAYDIFTELLPSKEFTLVNAPKKVKSKCNTDDTKECPYCAETIKAKAKICRFCNNELFE